MRQSLVVLLIIIAAGCRDVSRDDAGAAAMLSDAAAYLWSEQHDDGGWHSPTHGIASGGESWTPFVLYTLLNVPENIYRPRPEQIQRAVDFIHGHLREAGVIGHSNPIVSDYPNYATSYAVRGLLRLNTEDSLAIEAADYLRRQQMTEHRGFEPSDLAYGAWGFGEKNLGPGRPGHVDLSHTRRVVEALSEVDTADPSLKKALVFLGRLQNRHDSMDSDSVPYDGGFHASTVVEGVNKGGIVTATDSSERFFRSYASATADGVIALLAAGVDPSDSRVADAKRWLTTHARLDMQYGIPENSAIRWDEVMFFYHLSARSDVYSKLNGPPGWEDEIAALLRDGQHDDGRFANPQGGPNKEDDPLIATALAVNALTNVVVSRRSSAAGQ